MEIKDTVVNGVVVETAKEKERKREKIVRELEPKELQDLRQELADKEQELEELDDYEMSEEEYDEYLDDVGGEVDVLGIKYSMSKVLSEVDNIRYEMGKSEEEDRIREEKREELEGEIEDLKQQIEEF